MVYSTNKVFVSILKHLWPNSDSNNMRSNKVFRQLSEDVSKSLTSLQKGLQGSLAKIGKHGQT